MNRYRSKVRSLEDEISQLKVLNRCLADKEKDQDAYIAQLEAGNFNAVPTEQLEQSHKPTKQRGSRRRLPSTRGLSPSPISQPSALTVSVASPRGSEPVSKVPSARQPLQSLHANAEAQKSSGIVKVPSHKPSPKRAVSNKTSGITADTDVRSKPGRMPARVLKNPVSVAQKTRGVTAKANGEEDEDADCAQQ